MSRLVLCLLVFLPTASRAESPPAKVEEKVALRTAAALYDGITSVTLTELSTRAPAG